MSIHDTDNELIFENYEKHEIVLENFIDTTNLIQRIKKRYIQYSNDQLDDNDKQSTYHELKAIEPLVRESGHGELMELVHEFKRKLMDELPDIKDQAEKDYIKKEYPYK